MQFGEILVHFYHWFGQNHYRTKPQFCSLMCSEVYQGAVWLVLGWEIFQNFGLDYPNPKLIFPLFWAKF